jgi:AcrR family transcriptional regulator
MAKSLESAEECTPPEQGDISDAILTVALRRFGESGFKATTLIAIATEAGVSRPTVYSRYPDKIHLFRAVIKKGYDESLAAAAETIERGGEIEIVLSRVLLDYYGGIFDRFHGLPQVDELVLVQSEHAEDLVVEAREQWGRLLLRLFRQFANKGGVSTKHLGMSLPQIVDFVRLAPLSMKTAETTRRQYHKRLKNLAAITAAALQVD